MVPPDAPPPDAAPGGGASQARIRPQRLRTLRRISAEVSAADQLPRHLRSLVARRLQAFATLLGGLMVALLVTQALFFPLSAEVLPPWVRIDAVRIELMLVTLLLLVTSGAVVLYTRSPKATPRQVQGLGLLLQLTLALSIAAFEGPFVGDTVPWGVSWNCVFVVVFPLVVPSPTPRTVIASLLCVSFTPALAAVATLDGMPEPSWLTYTSMLGEGVVATALATVGARVVHRLDRAVERHRELGAYELEERLATGGMGEVWRARHRMLVRPAAVKIVRPEMLAEEGELDRLLIRFEREAQATANLESPHTVRLYDFGATDDGGFYYVMELLEGIDLRELVHEYGPMRPERVVHVLTQCCHSLAEAHALGLVHRDIKPANVMLCHLGPDYDFVKVLDFGLVKWHQVPETREALHVTQESAVPGTPAFMSPEAVRGTAPVDARSDVYSLGCVAYWMLTGRLVFEAESAIEMAVKHVRTEPTPPSRYAEHAIGDALEALVLECLAKAPHDRPPDAGALAARLAELETDHPWTHDRAKRWWQLHVGERSAERAERMHRSSLRPLRADGGDPDAVRSRQSGGA
ncbi:MAG TPA: serine/threonine-protein kinase [Sandaracinaceae bacterium LLY-WYZ-13_1]|nr:serine/threonine-protein kinase [Sandaracinaceae bacterium LLY-WYZ-13_1]